MGLNFTRLVAVLAAPLLLASCVLAPGKFTSTLTILADRSFVFTYQGEVYSLDAGDGLKGLNSLSSDDAGSSDDKDATAKADDAAKAARAKAEAEAKNKAIAEALGKEEGYRSVTYAGDGKFLIDYAIKGSLTHGFVFPYNSAAEAVFPFLAVELRKGGVVRMTAPGFANDNSKSSGGMGGGMGGGGADMGSKLDGVFTLVTDAEIVSQNNEDGVTTSGGRKTIVWKATPLSKTAPSAVLKLAPVAP